MEDFVSLEIAKKLEEKGFREECLCHYIGDDLVYNIESPIANNQLWFSHNKFDNIWHRDNIDAPTISQVLKWLREEKKIYLVIEVIPSFAAIHKVGFYYKLYLNSNGEQINCRESEESYMTFESASLAGIKDVLDYYI